ncbi:MAG: hypothetical protein ABI780_07435 [Ardenticatenales bacterium]
MPHTHRGSDDHALGTPIPFGAPNTHRPARHAAIHIARSLVAALVVAGTVAAAATWSGAATDPAARAAVLADCTGTSTGLVPLTELGAGMYHGYAGGLYGLGADEPPADHAALAAARAANIVPRGADGAPAADGTIVLLSLGMSNATQEFSAFIQRTKGVGGLNPRLVLVDGAQGGQTAAIIKDAGANFWKVVDQRLQAAGVTAAQVQALWIKEADAGPTNGFPAYAQTLADELGDVVRLAATRFPNAQLAYFSSRTYAGYASSSLNPEPYSYESAFSVQWLIRRQIEGDAALNADAAKGAVVAPALLWGPYLWADGLHARADGLWYECADFVDDGTHPSPAGGRPKVAALLDDFFRRDATSRPWFVADPAAAPPPPIVWPPAPVPGPTATPGGPTPTGRATGPRPTPPPGTPGAPLSFRVRERPSGATFWIVTAADVIIRRLRMLDGSRAAWLCGTVAPKSWEAGFTLEEPGLTLDLTAPPADRQTTVRAIHDDLAALTGQVRCLQVDRAGDESPSAPPGVPPRETEPATPTTVAEPSTPTAVVEPALAIYLPVAHRD